MANQEVLKLYTNVVYIVAVVVQREDGKYLLIQEAKQSCRGAWYLPAGKMDLGETIVEAAKRETKEEAGVDFTPSTLFHVECSHAWYRFNLTGTVTGKLKTLEQKDKESLQADWFSLEEMQHIKIRSLDMFEVISKHQAYCAATTQANVLVLPELVPHTMTSVRLIVLNKDRSKVFLAPADGNNSLFQFPLKTLPVKNGTVAGALYTWETENAKADVLITSLLALEHSASPPSSNQPTDGILFTFVAQTSNLKDDSRWVRLDQVVLDSFAKQEDRMIWQRFGLGVPAISIEA